MSLAGTADGAAMLTAMRAWWLLLVVVGCGDDLPSGDAHSGSRLRIPWFELDGTLQWQPQEGRHYASDGRFVNTETYFDQLRGEPCAPEPFLDGVTRCVPDVELINTKRYADAACTMRVTENPDRFKYVGDYDDKCNVRRMWKVFPVIATMPRGELYYRASDGKCWAASSSAAQVGVLGDELPYDTFATIDTEHAPDGKRIQLRYRSSEDGLVLPIGVYDGKLGPADIAYLGDYVALPPIGGSAMQDALFYNDATCAHGFVRVEAGCAAPSSAAGEWPTFYSTGDRATSPPMFARAFGTCMPLATAPDGDFYAVDTAVPLQPVVLEHSIASAGGRRIQLQFATSGGVLVRLRELYDTLLMANCIPMKFPDDVYRCAPDPAAAELLPGVYSDATCLTPIAVAQRTPNHAPARLALQDQALLGGALKIFELGEPYTDPLFSFGGNGTECVPYILDDVVRVGRQVQWSELATATLTTD